MRQESQYHKIRISQSGASAGTMTYSVTIPSPYKHWWGLTVGIYESGNCLILTSGAIPSIYTNKDLKNHSKVIERVKF